MKRIKKDKEKVYFVQFAHYAKKRIVFMLFAQYANVKKKIRILYNSKLKMTYF